MKEEDLDLSESIKKICDPLVSNPENVTVKLIASDRKSQSYLVVCDDDDLGKLIGRHGMISDSIRALVNISVRPHKKKVSIKFDSNFRDS